MIREYLILFFPPILIRSISYVLHYRKNNNPNILFEGDDSLFKNELNNAKFYGEYGVGKSTQWVLNNTKCKIVSVDSSSKWIAKVKIDQQKSSKRLKIHKSDLGNLREFGRPISYQKHYNFSDYTDYIWLQKEKPDVVLIDGRFRVCCFLTSLKFADEGTKIFLDDYINRPQYHFVEKYVSPHEACGRQSLFIVPSKSSIDIVELNKDINSFRFVMD